MIEKQTVEIAVCDAEGCGHRMYADEGGDFRSGFELTIVEYGPNQTERLEAFACKLTHIGKAAKAVLGRYHGEPEPDGDDDGPAWDIGDGELADREAAESAR